MIVRPSRVLTIPAIALACVALVGLPASSRTEPTGQAMAKAAQQESLTVDGNAVGRKFDGIGAVSAGASSRLLYDYPEPQRSEILDYLFEPNYGASMQMLKIEIGADTNSTDGSEPSHERVSGEVNCDRGYEWWLAEEAKKRNPDITLLGLQWGAPSWLEGGFWSQDNTDYLLSWLDCAEQRGLQIDYMGGWNERGYEEQALIDRARALKAEHPDVRFVAADDCPNCAGATDVWRIASDAADNPALNEALDAVGVHFACGHRSQYGECSSTPAAKNLGKPLWLSENASEAHDVGGPPIARALNRMYVDASITGYMAWSPVSAWYSNLPIADSGMTLAAWPWSGHYQIGSSVWSYAHTTQFTRPGWNYLDTGSGRLDSGASYVSLSSPDGSNFSTVVESLDVTEPTELRIEVTGGLPDEELQLWSSNLATRNTDDDMQHEGQLDPQQGAYQLTIQPGHVYTLSTTTGQSKGNAKPSSEISEQLPLPFHQDFDSVEPGKLAPYFSDINGGFETVYCGGGRDGQCYRQQVLQEPIAWNPTGSMEPTTMLGDPRWWGDYELATDVLLEQDGAVELIGRTSQQSGEWFGGYHLRLSTNGWELRSSDLHAGTNVLASGDHSLTPGQWSRASLRMDGNSIEAFLDGEQLTSVTDGMLRTGNVGLRVGGWQHAQFDNVSVEPIGDPPEFVPQREMTASASSHHGFYRGYTSEPGRAIDSRPETMWHSKFAPAEPLPQELTVDLGGQRDVQGIVIQPRYGDSSNGMITSYKVYASTDGATFDEVSSGNWSVDNGSKVVSFDDPVSATHLRVEATAGVNDLASIAELNVATAGLD